ncbi:hypothetical protein AVEN_229485-1 [Araneus ventricosus]|uniref:Uncharacterized protein n=1 Tax=Araneus ventricosus TaxID=182803 RepID=A0A4Y2MNQ7_ARAVE|nr:hypothetical protein AVEN_197403-1 [Araneus ventricosus]GBN29551.1 hypothetical protein AVEN_229485-1 [Araneus ventricosus]
MLSEIEILQILHNLPETDSGSDEKYDLSQHAYIPGNESEPTSLDECFTEIAQNVQDKLRKTYKTNCTKRTRPIAQNVQDQLHKTYKTNCTKHTKQIAKNGQDKLHKTYTL